MTNPEQDLIDMIAKATPDTPVNENHREALRRQVLDAYDKRQAQTRSDLPHNPLYKFTGATLMKLAASFTILAAVGVFAVTTLSPSKAIAFADIAKAILKIDNASYDTTTVTYMDGEKSVTEDTFKCYMQFPKRFRVEAPMDMVVIADVPADTMLMLNAQVKEAFLIEGLSNHTDATQPTNFIDQMQEQFRKAQDNKALDKVKYTELGVKIVNGQQAVGYRVQDADDQDYDTVDIWADAKTALPIQIIYTSVIDESTKVVNTIDNFKFDQKFDAAMFSLTPPSGYKVIKANDVFQQLDKIIEQLDKAIDEVK